MKSKFLLIIVTTVILLSFPHVNFGQAPNLGSAASFVLFSTTGLVSSTGISDITGNVGANTGAVTGFAGLHGIVYNADAVTAQTVTDLQSAYTQLNSNAATVFPGVLLGSGQILYAGVDSIAAATTLTSDLTLDAQGDPNAVFIIKIHGAFSTAANSIVNLVNGASACNVFWSVEGAISTATGTTMRGTLIANNAAISLAAGSTLEGRALSTTGAVSVDGTTANVGCGFAILPLELLSFTGVCDKQHVVLKWSTATETNNKYFEVERSAEGTNWQVVGTVEGAGSSSLLHTYSLTDESPGQATAYYRLKQTDFDGNYKYGFVVSVGKCSSGASDNLTLYPIPSTGRFDVVFTGDISQVLSIEVFNSQGEKVYGSIGFQSKIDLSGQAPGVYFVQLYLDSKTIHQQIVVKR